MVPFSRTLKPPVWVEGGGEGEGHEIPGSFEKGFRNEKPVTKRRPSSPIYRCGPGHGAAGELIHDDDLVLANDVVDVLQLQLLGPDGVEDAGKPSSAATLGHGHYPLE